MPDRPAWLADADRGSAKTKYLAACAERPREELVRQLFMIGVRQGRRSLSIEDLCLELWRCVGARRWEREHPSETRK